MCEFSNNEACARTYSKYNIQKFSKSKKALHFH